jgi:hypothetical protein
MPASILWFCPTRVVWFSTTERAPGFA